MFILEYDVLGDELMVFDRKRMGRFSCCEIGG